MPEIVFGTLDPSEYNRINVLCERFLPLKGHCCGLLYHEKPQSIAMEEEDIIRREVGELMVKLLYLCHGFVRQIIWK